MCSILGVGVGGVGGAGPAAAGELAVVTLPFGVERPSCSCLPRSQLSPVHKLQTEQLFSLGRQEEECTLGSSQLPFSGGVGGRTLLSSEVSDWKQAFRNPGVKQYNNKPSVCQFWGPALNRRGSEKD